MIYPNHNSVGAAGADFPFQSQTHFKHSLRLLEQQDVNHLYENVFKLIHFDSPASSSPDFEKKEMEDRAVIQLLEIGLDKEWFHQEDLNIINSIASQAKIRPCSLANSNQIFSLLNLAVGKINQEILVFRLAESIKSAEIDNIRNLFPSLAQDKIKDLTSLINIPELERSGLSPLGSENVIKDAEIVGLLLNLGFRADARNKNEETPLHLAAELGLDFIIEMLVKHQTVALQNSRPDLSLGTLNEMINAVDNDGFTPLHLAIGASSYSSAHFLLSNGADVNAATKTGLTPLHLAVLPSAHANLLPLLFNIAELNPNLQNSRGITPLILAIRHEDYEKIKFLLNSEKVDLLKCTNDQISPFMMLNTTKGKHYAELKKMFNDRDPLAKKISYEILSRKFLGHVSDTGGVSPLLNWAQLQYYGDINLEGYTSEFIWAKISKNHQAFKSIDPDLKSLLIETADFAALYKICSKTILERWRKGLPVYLDVGSLRHHMGMLLFRNEIVFLNRWEKLEGNSFYVAYQFDESLLDEALLEKMRDSTIVEPTAKLRFLTDELPSLLGCKKDFSHEIFEQIPVSAQKKVGNCIWLNNQGLELPLCVLYKKHELIRNKGQITGLEFEKICAKQKILWENLLSNHQHYPLNKALKKLGKNNFFKPDFELLSRVFEACYPYSKKDLFPEMIEKWTTTEQFFFEVMPQIYKERFTQIKIKEDRVPSQIQAIHLPPIAVPNFPFVSGGKFIWNVPSVSDQNPDPLNLLPNPKPPSS